MRIVIKDQIHESYGNNQRIRMKMHLVITSPVISQRWICCSDILRKILNSFLMKRVKFWIKSIEMSFTSRSSTDLILWDYFVEICNETSSVFLLKILFTHNLI